MGEGTETAASGPDRLTAPADSIPRRNANELTLGDCARAFLRQPHVKEAFSHFDAVTKAVIGVGGWNPPNSPGTAASSTSS